MIVDYHSSVLTETFIIQSSADIYHPVIGTLSYTLISYLINKDELKVSVIVLFIFVCKRKMGIQAIFQKDFLWKVLTKKK